MNSWAYTGGVLGGWTGSLRLVAIGQLGFLDLGITCIIGVISRLEASIDMAGRVALRLTDGDGARVHRVVFLLRLQTAAIDFAGFWSVARSSCSTRISNGFPDFERKGPSTTLCLLLCDQVASSLIVAHPRA